MINLKNVSKQYILSEENKINALEKINLKIKKGEFISIIGKSGSGKSTLLNIISCLDNNYIGEYWLNNTFMRNKRLNELASIRNNTFGFIFQNFNLLQKLSAYENIEIPLIYKKVPKKERKEIIQKISKKLEIEERLKHKPKELSGGEQQRVAIARALVTNPDIILADEPTGALDEKTGIQILNILKSLNKSGKTVIIVTHDLELSRLTNRTITLSDGKIISDKERGVNK